MPLEAAAGMFLTVVHSTEVFQFWKMSVRHGTTNRFLNKRVNSLFCACAPIVVRQWWCDSVAKSVKSSHCCTDSARKIIKRKKARIFSGVKKAEWHLSFHKKKKSRRRRRSVANGLVPKIPEDKLVDPHQIVITKLDWRSSSHVSVYQMWFTLQRLHWRHTYKW